MKIFVCEFITGGGLYRELLTPTLVKQGALMRDALLRDLSELEHIQVVTTHDARLDMPPNVGKSIPITLQEDVWNVWGQCIGEADAVWVISPETDGMLARLTTMAEERHKVVLGCSVEAVNLAASKYSSCKAMEAAGINTVPTYWLSEWVPRLGEAWVAKPDDGVGGEDSCCFESPDSLHAWLKQGREATYIIQTLQQGIPASISMLCNQGESWLLSCNRQKVALRRVDAEASEFVYSGSVVNDMANHWESFEEVAMQVAHAIPGLSGYVGIDVLVDGWDIKVLEINPRLTTSYAGLHEAMGHNPARLVIDLLYNEGLRNGNFQFPSQTSRHIVDINIHE